MDQIELSRAAAFLHIGSYLFDSGKRVWVSVLEIAMQCDPNYPLQYSRKPKDSMNIAATKFDGPRNLSEDKIW